ncbi:type 4b pilus protein PilO2 [Herbaspirillum sp. RV1423]|uniref:type 4b pilus protein PilO2 n=1 Tax=Herbaspirillum sp. RV1423 TaxID=1443993 RepID=UPI0004B9E75C|nr:type 4b pilus protein PilO2 [Herbaspirillum sp. RV1423]
MALYITQIDKYKFVCGLFWQSLSRPRELTKEAADLGRKIQSDLMVIRMDHSTAQAGFAQSKEGVRSGMFSLAAVVSKTLALEGAFYDGEQQPVHNWLGAFELPDGQWAYFAVRDANFLPNGDFAGSKEEVLDRLHSDYALGGWNVIIGEAELVNLGFHNFNARDIRSFIPRKKDGTLRIHKWWGLRQIDGTPSWIKAMAATTVVAVVAAGSLYGWNYYQKKKEEEARERAIVMVRENMLREASAAARPWSSRPAPLAMVRACRHQFNYVTAGGWELESYACTQEQQTYAWSRGNSTVAYLHEQVPGVVVEPSGEKASLTRPLKISAGPDDVLLDQRKLLESIVSPLQMMGLPVKVVAQDRKSAQGNAAQWQPSWKSFLFTLNARGVEPEVIATILNRPGVRVDKVIYRGSEWSMEGTIYAK